MRARISFETDATNDYFSRQVDPGKFSLNAISGNSQLIMVEDYSLNLQNGIATLNVKLPGGCRVGEIIRFVTSVSDSSQIEPYRNCFMIRVKSASEPNGGEGKRRKPPSEIEGHDREIPTGIQLPNWVRVNEADWNKHDPPFDQFTALRIKHAGVTETAAGNGKDIYDFFINEDNVHLKRYLKYEHKTGQSDAVARTRFELGLMLTGLALIHRVAQQKEIRSEDEPDNVEMNIEKQVANVTVAIAPFILPMIDALGALDSGEVHVTDASGEAT